jgi:hypothetical protein
MNEEIPKSVLLNPRQPEGPYEAGPPKISGKLSYPCCGETWTVTGDNISHVKCPDCGILYVIALKFSVNPPVEQPYAPGTKLIVLKEFTTKTGARETTAKVGEIFKVGFDPYGVFSLNPGTILLEFHSVGLVGPRILLGVAPLTYLKAVEENEHHKGNDKDRG